MYDSDVCVCVGEDERLLFNKIMSMSEMIKGKWDINEKLQKRCMIYVRGVYENDVLDGGSGYRWVGCKIQDNMNAIWYIKWWYEYNNSCLFTILLHYFMLNFTYLF